MRGDLQDDKFKTSAPVVQWSSVQLFLTLAMHETIKRLGVNIPGLSTCFVCKVFEDNNGALLLTKNQRTTSRTKYFHLKWYFFWQYIKTENNPDGIIDIEKVDSVNQRSDYLMKGMLHPVFKNDRKLNQGC